MIVIYILWSTTINRYIYIIIEKLLGGPSDWRYNMEIIINSYKDLSYIKNRRIIWMIRWGKNY